MKKILNLIIFVIVVCCVYSCSDWTEVEQACHTDLTEYGGNKSPEFFENLRAYKNSSHPVSFGWFSGWTGGEASMQTSLRGLPDSVDMVSIWGGWQNLSESKKKDLKYVQEVKGTKVLMCFIVGKIGAQLTPQIVLDNWKENNFKSQEDAVNAWWGWTDDSEEGYNQAIINYANAICDTIFKYNYDGFDLDLEPHYGSPGNIASYPQKLTIFLTTMRERLGMRTETGKILAVDGEPTWLEPEMGKLMDYYIFQAYGATEERILNMKLNSIINHFGKVVTDHNELARKVIVTENFEKYSKEGGADFTDRFGNKMKSVEGMSRWIPIVDGVEYPKGGVGTYHMEYEYLVNGHEGTYPFLRNAIRIMNPPIK